MTSTDNALAEAERRYRRQTMHVGTAQDREVSAFVAGAEWAAGRAETTARCIQCVEFHPDNDCADVGCRHNCEAYIRAETTTATDEDAEALALRLWDEGIVRPEHVAMEAVEAVLRWLAEDGLLATARTRPTREQIASAIGNARWGDEWLGVPDAPLLRQADVVLALLNNEGD